MRPHDNTDPGQVRPLAHRPLVLLTVATIIAALATSGCNRGNTPSQASEEPGPPPSTGEAHPTGDADPAATNVDWRDPIVVATGPAVRGPWRMNRSTFNYVDDATIALGTHEPTPDGPAAGIEGRTAIAWVDNQRQNVFFQRFDADGQPQLDAPVDVSRSPEIFSWLPRMAVSSDTSRVFVLWQEIVFSGGSHGGEIFFSRSLDGGESFSPPSNLSTTINGAGKGRLTKERWDNGSLDLARLPAADVGDPGHLVVAWTEYQGMLRVRRSTDDGASFDPAVHVAGTEASPARGPSLAIAPDATVYLAWTVGETDDADIHIARSTDGGTTFETPRILDSDGHADAPKIAVDSRGALHVVYDESPSGPFGRSHLRYVRIAAAAFVDPDAELGPTRRIAGPGPDDVGAAGASFASIAIDDQDRVVVIWERRPELGARPRGLGFTTSSDRGATFAPASTIPGTADPSLGFNGSLQGLLSRKLALGADGDVGVVSSHFDPRERSVVRWVPGRLR